MKNIILALFISFIYAQSIPHNIQALEQIKALNHSQDKFSFAVMGDNRGGYEILKDIIQRIDRDRDILFSIDGGDLVTAGYAKEYERYLSLINISKKPILTVIGNHEIPWYDGEKNYEEYMGERYYSFAFGNSYFIILDDANKKGIDKKQKEWMIKELKKSQKYTHRFVFFHVPLYDPREGEYAKGHSLKNIEEAKELNDIFDRYKVAMIFTSHIHIYFRGRWQKTPFIISGGAGAPLKQYKDSGFFHYIKVEVNRDKVDYKVIKIDIAPPSKFDRILNNINAILGF